MKQRRMLGLLDLILGILLLLSGLYALTHPLSALVGMTLLYGLLAVGTGIVDIVFYCKMERRTGFGPVAALITGILSLIAGIILLVQPQVGSVSLALLFPLWFIAHCISGLGRLSLVRWIAGNAYYYLSLVVNILGLILGLMMLFSPMLTVVSLPWVAGLYLFLLGLNSIVLGIGNIISRH